MRWTLDKATGLFSGAPDIVFLALSPAFIFNGNLITHMLIIAGVGLSALNTRAIIAFALMALIFLKPKEHGIISTILLLVMLLISMGANLLYMWAGFMVEGGIQ